MSLWWAGRMPPFTLCVDRDSELVALDFERDPGVMKMVSLAIQRAKRNHRHSASVGRPRKK